MSFVFMHDQTPSAIIHGTFDNLATGSIKEIMHLELGKIIPKYFLTVPLMNMLNNAL